MKPHTICLLLLLASTAIPSFADGHTFLWWADGLRGQSPEGRRMLHVQTNHYGMALDVERADITRIGTFEHPAPYSAAVEDSNTVIAGLRPAKLILSVTVDGTTYTCTGAAADTRDHANYPVRQIAGGRFLQRFDILGLEFADPAGNRLDATGRLEVAAWPDHYNLTLEITPANALDDVQMAIELHEGGGYCRVGDIPTDGIAAGKSGTETLGWYLDKSDLGARQVRVTDPRKGDAALPVQYDTLLGGHVVSLPPRNWDMAEDLDRLDRFPVTLENTGDVAMSFPLVFAFEGPFQGITGMSAMLRDKEGNPTGIPVQISKNWHRLPERTLLYEGPWFNGITQVTVPPGGRWEGEFAVTYARWGGVPAASHAQLCLIGWGGNQLWDQAAIGSFGESICYDPEVGLNRSMIDDVRPLMVTGMNSGQWQWTHNVGGGDFLVYFNGSGAKQYLTRMRTAYLSQGPNLTRVVYAGVSADGKIAARIEVSTPRCDDVNRAYHRIRYEVLEAVEFSRLAFYQLGADNYNDHQFTAIARGDRDGLTEEWETGRGGKKYLRTPMECAGKAPWFALLGGIRGEQWKEGAWADRGLVVREWRARLGGKDVPRPFAAVYGTKNGIPSANIELVPPPGLTRLEPGDFVEAEVELLVVPQRAEDYYGPNTALRADLAENGGTWRVIHRLARGNDLKIEMKKGTLARRFPVEVAVDSDQTAECVLRDGLGYVPVTFTGLKRASGHVLRVNGTVLDQSVHGNDFWQVTQEDGAQTFSITYNIPCDGEVTERRLELSQRIE